MHHGLPTKPPWRPINFILNFLTAYLQSLLILLIIVFFEPEAPPRYNPKSRRAPQTWVKACANKAKVQLARLCGKLEETMYAVLRSTSSQRHRTKRNFRFRFTYLAKRVKAPNISTFPAYALHGAVTSRLDSSLRHTHFDTDSVPLRVDNCTSRSMSPYVSNFITPLQPEHYMRVQGMVEKVGGLQTGTIQWKIEDD